jgi:hypothetical protein
LMAWVGCSCVVPPVINSYQLAKSAALALVEEALVERDEALVVELKAYMKGELRQLLAQNTRELELQATALLKAYWEPVQERLRQVRRGRAGY